MLWQQLRRSRLRLGRCEEAELAAALGSRRAVAAEARAAQAENHAKDLAWQVSNHCVLLSDNGISYTAC